MSGLIRISGGASTGKENKVPVVINLLSSEQTANTISISYYAKDYNGTILRHYIYLDGVKTEITDNVVFDSEYGIFRYILTGLTKSTTYNIQIEVSDGLDIARSDVLNISTKEYVIYGIRIDEGNSNPETCCRYIEDSKGTETATDSGLGGWENKFPFNQIRIVGLKNGQVTKEIKKDNKKQYIDGTNVEGDVDVMVEIPKLYWDCKTIDENIHEIRYSDVRFNETCDCYAFKADNTERNYIYIGAYLASESVGKLRSVSGVKPLDKKSLADFRTLAQANGEDYHLLSIYTISLLQILAVMLYKRLNINTILRGFKKQSLSLKNTGETDDKGFIYSNEQYGISFLGIENLFGYLMQSIDGIYIYNMNIYLSKDNKNFYDENSYVKSFLHSYVYGYIDKVKFYNSVPFYPISDKGGQNIYYCTNSSNSSSDKYKRFGGFASNPIYDRNIFSIFGKMSSAADSYTTSRLVYLGE